MENISEPSRNRAQAPQPNEEDYAVIPPDVTGADFTDPIIGKWILTPEFLRNCEIYETWLGGCLKAWEEKVTEHHRKQVEGMQRICHLKALLKSLKDIGDFPEQVGKMWF